jgi:hypothetical protein
MRDAFYIIEQGLQSAIHLVYLSFLVYLNNNKTEAQQNAYKCTSILQTTPSDTISICHDYNKLCTVFFKNWNET